MSNQITAWSFSRYKTYQECPAKAKYKFILKMQEPANEAMNRGTNIHKMAEDYTKGLIKKLPAELVNFKEEFAELKKSKPVVEEQWAFNIQWIQTDWFAKDVWTRIKVDAVCLDEKSLFIIDHKTGKRKEDHLEQLSLYAIAGSIVYPSAEEIHAQLWYTDSGDLTHETYSVKDIPGLKKDWEKKTRAMLNDKSFVPRPGNYCRWCHFSKSKGGPCKF